MREQIYPFQWLTACQIKVRLQRTIFANFDLISILKLAEQETRFSFVVVESHWTSYAFEACVC